MKKMHILFVVVALVLGCHSGGDKLKNHPPKSFEVTVNVYNSVVTLTWEKPIDPDGDKVIFSILDSEGKVIQSQIQSNYYSFTNVSLGRVYSGWVEASDGKGGKTRAEYRFESSYTGEKNSDSYNAGEFVIPSSLKKYYSQVNFSLKGEALKNELADLTISKHTHFLTYSERHPYLNEGTQDPNNPSNVVLVYDSRSVLKGTRAYNTEHIYPKSYLTGKNAANDLHNFYPCTERVNSARGNKPFTDGAGTYQDRGAYWYPGDDWRGDVARIIFYINLRYNDSVDRVSTGGIAMLLKWNVLDPVSELEIQRNNVFERAQGNRNVFIDNPYLATLIWGGAAPAQNRWKP